MKIEKITARIGARISDVDMSQPLDAGSVAAIRKAFDDHLVLVFAGQKPMSNEAFLRMGRHFGEIEVPDFQTRASTCAEVMILDQTSPQGQGADNWHSDSTYLEDPPMATMLQAHMLPSAGGDTCFSSMYAAYEALSPPMQRFLEGLTSAHGPQRLIERTRAKALYTIPDSLAKRAPVSHPVIAVHPETGRRLLFVNSNWTLSIDGMSEPESQYLIDFLFEHIKSPEFQMRHRWSVGDVVIWDNRCAQHYAVADYTGERRLMHRIVVLGKTIRGVKDAPSTPASRAA